MAVLLPVNLGSRPDVGYAPWLDRHYIWLDQLQSYWNAR
jgi:hypothetical protein